MKLSLCRGVYELADDGGTISNGVPTMIYLLFKSTNPDTSIGVYNLKDEIEKATLAKFDSNVKDLLYDMSSYYSIIIDKVERHEYYVCHIFRALFTGPNSTFNCCI